VLARIEPLPVRISRSVAEPGSFEAARVRGLEHYRDGDYDVAAAAFGDALTLKPGDAEILVYLGSTELLRGDDERAARYLEAGLAVAEAAPLREELLWQLANARLRAGNVAGAKQALSKVVELGRAHASEARQLLDSIER
jgi:Flp pilus assembly protein TadD